jgi:high affinity sulfate transporter 1
MEPEPSPFRAPDRPRRLRRLVPVAGELPAYRPRTGVRDVLAAVTVAAVAIPAAMGYAEVAGLAPVNGLYALVLPAVVYALLGSSRQLSVGPDGSISALVGALVLGSAAAGSAHATELAATLALLVAACFGAAYLLRLGWLADYLSRPVLVGYIHGVVVVLIAGQLGKLLGIDVAAGEPVPQLLEVLGEVGSTSLPTLAVGTITLLALLTLRRWVPRVPGPLVLVVLGIAISSALALDRHGVAVVGAIPAGLPPVSLPSPSTSDVAGLVPTAIGLFLIAFADSVLTARTFAGRHGQHVDAGQELLAIGATNAAAGLSQALPVGASGSRTAVNDAAGVRTQLAGILSAVVVCCVLLFLTEPLASLPKAVLAAIIVAAAIGLVNPAAWRQLADVDRVELAIAAVTAAGVVVTGVLPAIAFAVGLSIVDVARRSARPHDAVLGWVPELGRYGDVAIHRAAQQTPGVVVYRVDDRVFFANASYVKARALEAVRASAEHPRWLIVDAEGVTHVDVAGGRALIELFAALGEERIGVRLARVRTPLLRRLEELGIVDAVGAGRVHPTVQAAVAACDPDAGRSR